MEGFFAYPSNPKDIGEVVTEAARQVPGLTTWEQNDIAGRFIVDPVFEQISGSDYLAADITKLNFNVSYEIGYAIGKARRVYLVKSGAIQGDDDTIQEIGIYDTLGYETYTSSEKLREKLQRIVNTPPLQTDLGKVNGRQPVYLVLPRYKTDYEIHILARINIAKLGYRSFDPEEHGRLSAREAIKQVALSHGVVVPLIPKNRKDESVHNNRAAFVAGLATGMEKVLLLLQKGEDPVPLDYRDLVTCIHRKEQIDKHVGDFAAFIADRLQQGTSPVVPQQKTFLAALNLGASSAENEMRDLGEYYLETDEYRRAARGEGQVIAGRKGSGKTALFVQLRDKLKQHRQTIVLDLKPEGFQLLKFKDVVLEHLEHGTKAHTITAFWEYLLLLETCHKILEQDQQYHINDHSLNGPYRDLAKEYGKDAFVTEGDFAERIMKLTERMASNFRKALGSANGRKRLTQEELTNLIYQHDMGKLRNRIRDYLLKKKGLWILFDNLDKGWPPQGLKPDDLLILRCLLEAMGKLERFLRHHDNDIDCHGMVFIRDDVYEHLLENTPDRGKIKRIGIDWSSADLLRELLRRRIVASGGNRKSEFEEIWRSICVSHVKGVESSTYLIDRCLMRPRYLIDLVNCCQSHAVNLNQRRIEERHIIQGEEVYSNDLVVNFALEIRDVFPDLGDMLYEFVGSPAILQRSEVEGTIRKAFTQMHFIQLQEVTEYLLWCGFFGFVRPDGKVLYIYDLKYDWKVLKALIGKECNGQSRYQINPAFWAGLLIESPISA